MLFPEEAAAGRADSSVAVSSVCTAGTVRVSSATALAGAAAVVGADVFPAGEATGAGALSVVCCEEAGLIIRQLVDHLGDGIRAARRGEQEDDESDGEDGTHGDSSFLFAEEISSYNTTWFRIICIVCGSGNNGAPLAKFSCQFPHPLIQYVLLQRYAEHNI